MCSLDNIIIFTNINVLPFYSEFKIVGIMLSNSASVVNGPVYLLQPAIYLLSMFCDFFINKELFICLHTFEYLWLSVKMSRMLFFYTCLMVF
ncbi:hypothetical protein RIR_jg13861.t1 [Rhizophagus irregularis DAOM 181602=DAOM 197198]|nr:hypothetical protein RIR_jg13861.t1 [Rhizophagus irregularis DAOM 181602=DAOM 197198]